MSETITPTEADLARDLRADLEAYQERAALVDEIAMHSGCTDYACYCHFILPAALRRAIAAEARVKDLEQVLLQGVEQLKSMRAETDRLSREAELFKQHLGVQE